MSTPTPYINQGEPWGFRPIHIIREIINGKLNCAGSVTLDASSATTTLTDPLIKASSKLFFNPETANAQAIALPRAACSEGSATLTHANDANADKTFSYLIIG